MRRGARKRRSLKADKITLCTLIYTSLVGDSPAMAAGIVDTLWGMEDIAALCEARAATARGSYGKRSA
jgi:hypothetical protein